MRPMRLALAVAAATLALAGSAVAQTVIVVRHAEQDRTVPGNDPPLSAAGQARAEALKAALARAGVSTILTSPLRRTVDTAAPLATSLGLTSRAVPLGATHVADVVAAARAAGPKAVVLVVGHSNTAPAIVAGLGGKPAVNLLETVYDTLTTLRLDGAATLEIDSRYGAPTP